MADSKRSDQSDFQLPQFSKCLTKISEIGPWVSGLNWCGLTYMTGRQKTQKMHSLF
jgi:hypothetical protein